MKLLNHRAVSQAIRSHGTAQVSPSALIALEVHMRHLVAIIGREARGRRVDAPWVDAIIAPKSFHHAAQSFHARKSRNSK